MHKALTMGDVSSRIAAANTLLTAALGVAIVCTCNTVCDNM